MRGNYARIITTFTENCHQRRGWGHSAQQQWFCCDKSVHLPFVLLNAWTVCCYEHTLAHQLCVPACK